MLKKMKWLNDNPGASTGRTVLYFDPDESYAVMLHDVWKKLQLADDLHIVGSQEEALAYLDAARRAHARTAAIVLDPEATGEATGAFVCALRKHCGKKRVPIMFWSRDSQKYEVLEGRGIESVHRKPMVLRLVQSLDAACQLGVERFSPHPGNSIFVNTSRSTSAATVAVT